MMAPMLTAAGSMSLLTIPSDNGTWSLTLYGASDDTPLRRFRDPEVYDRVVRAFPLHAHWLDGEPISEVASMTGVVDRSRRYVVDRVPLATGIISIADAWACTNPSLGRGMSIGLIHTALARRVVGDHLDDPEALALAFDAGTRAEVEPWHDATRELDRARVAEMRAHAAGVEPPSSPVLDLSVALSAAARAATRPAPGPSARSSAASPWARRCSLDRGCSTPCSRPPPSRPRPIPRSRPAPRRCSSW